MSAPPMILLGTLPLTRHGLVAALSNFGRKTLAIACIALAAGGVLALRYVLFEHFHGGHHVLHELLRFIRDE